MWGISHMWQKSYMWQKSCVAENMWDTSSFIRTKNVGHIGATGQIDVTQFLSFLCNMSHVTQFLYMSHRTYVHFIHHRYPRLLTNYFWPKKHYWDVMYFIWVHTSCYSKCVHEVYNLSLSYIHMSHWFFWFDLIP